MSDDTTYREKLREKERLARERHERMEAMYGRPKLPRLGVKRAKPPKPPKVETPQHIVRLDSDPTLTPHAWFWGIFGPSEIQADMKFQANPAPIDGIAMDYYSPRFKVAIELFNIDSAEDKLKAKDKKKALQRHGIALLRVKAPDPTTYGDFLKRLGMEHRKRKHYEYRTMKKKVEHHVPRSLRDIKYPDKRVDTNPVRNRERDKLFAGVVNEIDLKKKLPF